MNGRTAEARPELQALRRRVRKLQVALDAQTDRCVEATQRADRLREMVCHEARREVSARRHLSEMIHDQLQQHLAGARLRLSMLRKRTEDGSAHGILDEIDELLKESIDSARAVVTELGPSILYHVGLSPALEWLARNLRDAHGLEVSLDADEVIAASDEIAATLFHAVRELLFNVALHSGTRHAELRVRVDGDQLEIEVEDHGSGFPPPSACGQGASTRGFGLFGIRERLEAIGGQLAVDSAPGKGTKVTLVAPLFLTTPSQDDREANASSTLGPSVVGLEVIPTASQQIRLLLVDDHQVVREGLAGIISDEPDMEVAGQASNGKVGLEMAMALRPDLIVMDLTMPVMNGIEATRQISAALPGVPVIGLSAHDREDMARDLIAAGGVAYLSKGGPTEDLLAIIRASVAKARSTP